MLNILRTVLPVKFSKRYDWHIKEEVYSVWRGNLVQPPLLELTEGFTTASNHNAMGPEWLASHCVLLQWHRQPAASALLVPSHGVSICKRRSAAGAPLVPRRCVPVGVAQAGGAGLALLAVHKVAVVRQADPKGSGTATGRRCALGVPLAGRRRQASAVAAPVKVGARPVLFVVYKTRALGTVLFALSTVP